MSQGLVVIPTYNEKGNIVNLIKQILTENLPLDILVVDDNSPDGTGELVEDLIKNEPRLFILHRLSKEGIGRAYIDGFKWALGHDYEYIFEMDADFSHQTKYLKDFLEAIKDNDLVLGSRYIKEGGGRGWSFIRKSISYLGCLYARLILGINIKDLTGGFKCFRRQVLQSINLDLVKSNGFVFQIEITYLAIKKGFQIKEIPITFVDRASGRSKFDKSIFWEALLKIWQLRFGK